MFDSRPVLALDPGLATLGYAVVATHSGRFIVSDYGRVKTSPRSRNEARLMELHRAVAGIIREFQPSVVAIERLFFSTNVKTAMSVGQAKGVLLLTAAEADLPVTEYTPLEVKKSVTGDGGADKGAVRKMVRLLLNLKVAPPDDAADALALALCHLNQRALRAQVQA